MGVSFMTIWAICKNGLLQDLWNKSLVQKCVQKMFKKLTAPKLHKI